MMENEYSPYRPPFWGKNMHFSHRLWQNSTYKTLATDIWLFWNSASPQPSFTKGG